MAVRATALPESRVEVTIVGLQKPIGVTVSERDNFLFKQLLVREQNCYFVIESPMMTEQTSTSSRNI